jgi:hypothetical protein
VTKFQSRGLAVAGAGALALLLAGAVSHYSSAQQASAGPEWAINTTLIEACSCTMFCPCFFNTEPSPHGGSHGDKGHYCEFNIAYKVNGGRYGGTNLDGVKFWVAGDLGADFSDGRLEWAVLTFDPEVTPQQKEAVQAILGHLYPVEWKSFSIASDAKVDWTASDDRAEARLDGGQAAEVVLKRHPGNTSDPVVIDNLKYWAAPRNDGVVLMPNEVQAYRLGGKAFETRGTNGFMITVDMASSDL